MRLAIRRLAPGLPEKAVKGKTFSTLIPFGKTWVAKLDTFVYTLKRGVGGYNSNTAPDSQAGSDRQELTISGEFH